MKRKTRKYIEELRAKNETKKKLDQATQQKEDITQRLQKAKNKNMVLN